MVKIRHLSVPIKLRLEKLFNQCPTPSDYEIKQYANSNRVSKTVIQTWFALRPLGESDSCCFLCPSFFNLRGNDVIHRNICWRGICWTGHNSFCCNQSDSPFGAARRRPKLTRRKPNIRKNRLVKMPVWPDWKFYDLRMQPVVLVRKLELPCSCPF